MVSDVWMLSSSPRVSDSSKQWVWSNRLYAEGSAFFLSLKGKLLSKQGILGSWIEILDACPGPLYLCLSPSCWRKASFLNFFHHSECESYWSPVAKDIWGLPSHLVLLWDCDIVPPVPVVWLQCFPFTEEQDGALAASSSNPVITGNPSTFLLPGTL